MEFFSVEGDPPGKLQKQFSIEFEKKIDLFFFFFLYLKVEDVLRLFYVFGLMQMQTIKPQLNYVAINILAKSGITYLLAKQLELHL